MSAEGGKGATDLETVRPDFQSTDWSLGILERYRKGTDEDGVQSSTRTSHTLGDAF